MFTKKKEKKIEMVTAKTTTLAVGVCLLFVVARYEPGLNQSLASLLQAPQTSGSSLLSTFSQLTKKNNN